MPLPPDFQYSHYCAMEAARPMTIQLLTFYVNVNFCHADFLKMQRPLRWRAVGIAAAESNR
jgi:hypothetical protein